MTIVLDTSVLIDVLRNRKDRRALLAKLLRDGNELATTVLNVAELYAGMRSGEEASTEILLAALQCFDIGRTEARLAGQLKNIWQRKGQTLNLSDTLIAATTITHQCVLFTDNIRDFPMPELNLRPL